jgi:hypothetical protein
VKQGNSGDGLHTYIFKAVGGEQRVSSASPRFDAGRSVLGAFLLFFVGICACFLLLSFWT